MLLRRLQQYPSIRFSRPLRPPSKTSPSPRPFTQNSQLLLLAQHTPRPQLPYLAQPSFHRSSIPRVSRLISTETKAYVKEVSWLSIKYTALIWVLMTLGGIAMFGIGMEQSEREQPTPSEWRFLTRQILRQARDLMKVVEKQEKPMVDWPRVGERLKECLKRLEALDGDGEGLVVQGGEAGGEAEEILIPDVGKAGFDITAKSYAWKTGYHEVLMLVAQAAEHIDNMVLDRTRKMIFPKQVVIGPSNPDPRPTPVYMAAAPREEDCESFFDPPETYYMKILTTKGFTTRQRLDAVEGYANWLEFKGLPESAEEMYLWGIDIAKAGLPNPAVTDQVIDIQTNVLKDTAYPGDLSPNLLRATTNLATHYARSGKLDSALPILLSVLRARRSAPVGALAFYDETAASQAKTDIGAAVSMVKRWISTPPFPPPPPSGDTPLARQSTKPTCEEGELMLYIGEILFASAPERASEGVGWTRQAALTAEANLQSQQTYSTMQNAAEEAKESKRCKQCLLTGVNNWETMLQRLTEVRAASSEREGGRDAGWLEWRGWFGSGGGVKGKTLEELSTGILEEELKQVGRLRERIVRENIEVEMAKSKYNAGLWFG